MDLRSDRILSELRECELSSLEAAADGLGLPSDAWPHIPFLRGWILAVVVRRRVDRLTRVERIPTASAFRRTAGSFGLTPDRVRGLYYRSLHQADAARELIHDSCQNGSS